MEIGEKPINRKIIKHETQILFPILFSGLQRPFRANLKQRKVSLLLPMQGNGYLRPRHRTIQPTRRRAALFQHRHRRLSQPRHNSR